MHISVICPRCKNEYQLETNLVGKKIRCPNSQCREIIDVQAADNGQSAPSPTEETRRTPSAPESKEVRKTGSISDMIPMVSGDAIQPPPPKEAKVKEASWQNAPPTRKDEEETSESPPSSPPPLPEKSSAPKVVNWRDVEPAPEKGEEKPTPPATVEDPSTPKVMNWQEAAPPPKSGEETVDQIDTVEEPQDDLMPDPSAKRRRARLYMIAIGLTVVGILGGAAYYLIQVLKETEAEVLADAERLYNGGTFDIAATRFETLIKEFPESEHLEQYRFMVDLSMLRDQVSKPHLPLGEVYDKTNKFIRKHEKSEFLEEKSKEVLEGAVTRTSSFLEKGERVDPKIEPEVNQAEEMIQQLDRRFPKAITADEQQKLTEGFAKIREAIALERKRRAYLAKMKALPPSAQSIRQAKIILKEATIELPNFPDDPDAQGIVEDLYTGHKASVKYVTGGQSAKPGSVISEDRESSILVTPSLSRRNRLAADDKVVLGLARGVLYAFYASNGLVKWAKRVGIDTTTLPIRLPASPTIPTEMILVLSTDTRSLLALDLEGRTIWRYRFDSPALGRPLIVDNRAFVPTFAGDVHEIEVVQGTLIGKYILGQRLSIGGAHQRLAGARPDEYRDFLYFPADDSCIYILDVTNQTCEQILYTWHPSGAIRSRPLLLGGAALPIQAQGPRIPSYLVLNQTDGVDSSQMRVYDLPIDSRDKQPLRMRPSPLLKGWSWFPPYHDGEKLVVLSDAAQLGLFGIRQQRNNDNPLFPLLPMKAKDGASMGSDLTEKSKKFFELPEVDDSAAGIFNQRQRGRAQVAHVLGQEFWVLAMGQLQRLEIRWDRQTGPQLVKRWLTPLKLGSPLHDTQVIEDFDELKLYIVTQQLDGTDCTMTALSPESPFEDVTRPDRRILWQRQLGIICPTAPVPVGNALIAIDTGGSLHHFEPAGFPDEANTWHAVESPPMIHSNERDSNQSIQFLRDDNKRIVYQVMTQNDGQVLVLRKYVDRIGGGPGTVTEQRVTLNRPLAGTIAKVGQHIIIPLQDGKFYRYTLELKSAGGGYTWRSRQTSTTALCHILDLGNGDFLTTDGRNGIQRWRWNDEERFGRNVPLGPGDGARRLSEYLVGRPLILSKGGNGPTQLLIAGRQGALRLLEGDKLEPKHGWKLQGEITAGPFLRGNRVGCIIDHQRLVWLDSTKKDVSLWEYDTGGPSIVGEPQQVDDMLIVADESGRYVGLDPQSGERFGKGYIVKATVAPSSTPVAFGKNRAFAPLTDGTILLLSLDLLRDSWWGRIFD